MFLTLCIAHCALLIGCSIPVLEPAACTDAGLSVRQFYSFHLGNDMTPSAENLKARQKYLTPELFKTLADKVSGATDYFTKADTYPKTFKIGKCESPDPTHAKVQVQVFWQEERGATKDTTQREVSVDATKTTDGRWLIADVEQPGTK